MKNVKNHTTKLDKRQNPNISYRYQTLKYLPFLHFRFIYGSLQDFEYAFFVFPYFFLFINTQLIVLLSIRLLPQDMYNLYHLQ